MKVLVIAPHMDDEVLGCGATIARHIEQKDEVSVCFIAHRVYHHKYDEEKNRFEMECARNAQKILGYTGVKFLGLNDERLDLCLQDILIPLEEYVSTVNPEVVYLNHKGDNNQDHRAVFQASMVALRPSANPGIKKIYCYEVSSSTEQAPPVLEQIFFPNYYVNIEKYFKLKLDATRCYRTETRDFPHPRSTEALEILAKKRGIDIGFRMAEAFMVLREKWD